MKLITDELTNTCFFSERLLEYPGGENVVHRVIESGIEVRLLQGTRDVWCRDYMPIQIEERKFVSYEYTPDYLNNPRDINFQTNPARICRNLGIDVLPSGIILDGGNVVKTSKGIIMVDKIVRENSHIRKSILIDRLEEYFDNEIILLAWDREEKYGHADGIVREISNGKVLMTNYHQYDKNYATKFEKILSKHFDIEMLDYDVQKPCKYNWCYINFLRLGNKLFLPQLTWEDYSGPKNAACPHEGRNFQLKHKWYHHHIEEDSMALEQFQRIFPKCEIIQVSCPQIVENGGALNCVSWNVKL